MKYSLIIPLLAAAMIATAPNEASAQKGRHKKGAAAKTEVSAAAKDSSKTKAKTIPLIGSFVKTPQMYKEGMTPVYVKEGKYYLQLSDSLLGRDMMMVSRISKGAAGIRNQFDGYAGDDIAHKMFRFEKSQDGKKIFLKNILLRERAKGDMAENVAASNMQAIAAAFEVKAQSANKDSYLIDITDFLLSDTEYLFFNKKDKTVFKLGSMQKDKSFITGIKSFPINTEMKVVYTYARTDSNPTATFEFNVSLVLLPKVPMVARYEDPRVGYFIERYVDFDKNPQGVESVKMISRWRLEPKPEDIEKYKRGELVEPAKPIVFYIDPATPKQWVPYLIAGVNDWQPVFEKAGFKNAIYALEAPTFEQDSTWSLDDARHSAIVYKPSDVANAMGPHISDPRSGEIIESHICWYHNVMSLLRNWYFIQASPADPAARHLTFDPELMGQLVRFVSSHEVGHTLGLRHNFMGSAHYSVEQLRDPEFVKKNGHTTSIMDYSRFNYVAQPEDKIEQSALWPRIGVYDNWAIEWGYRRFYQYDDPQKELEHLNKWIIEKTSDPLLLFGTESNSNDPRFQSEDLGSNQMEANEYGVKNLKFIMNNLIDWTTTPGKGYDDLNTLYNEIVNQYVRYMNHVAKWVGGVYFDAKTSDQPGEIYTHVEKAKQKEALAFLNKNLFTPQTWLIPNEIMSKTINKPQIIVDKTYSKVLGNMVSKRALLNMVEDEIKNGKNAYGIDEFFKDLNSMILVSISPDKTKASLQRLLQKRYVVALIAVYNGEGGPFYKKGDENKDNTDIISTVHTQLKDLQKRFNSLAASSTGINRAHYMFLADKIAKRLDSDK